MRKTWTDHFTTIEIHLWPFLRVIFFIILPSGVLSNGHRNFNIHHNYKFYELGYKYERMICTVLALANLMLRLRCAGTFGT